MKGQPKLKKILIVEDDDISYFLLSILLKKISEEILHANNGEKAIEMCRSNPDIDLIMMDIQMPIMGGYEATQEIRKFNTSAIIVAQTAYALESDRQKAIEVGCTEYLSKPIKEQKIVALLNEYFDI